MSTTKKKRLPLDHTAAAEGRRLVADPNIVSVGFGLKFVGGKPTMQSRYITTCERSSVRTR